MELTGTRPTAWLENHRIGRLHKPDDKDQRKPFQRDRDRVHYSSAFRRLGGVSQVVSAEHIEPFHNRLTHTLKVAQLGRRLAEHIIAEQPDEAENVGLDPEVVEAACLAHDLGHAPFGHVGEDALNDLVIRSGDEEGYEGNPQSLRIITKLAVRSTTPGLDLTRATINATIKYPWSHAEATRRKKRKFGFYRTEKADFDDARGDHPPNLSIEAAIMDYADDIAYSVHDIEDFHRIRAIPWHLLNIDMELGTLRADALIKATLEAWSDRPDNAQSLVTAAADRLLNLTERYDRVWREPYEGTRGQRMDIRAWSSLLIRRFVQDFRPVVRIEREGAFLDLHPDAQVEIRLLKQVIRTFVIEGQTIGAQRIGQKRVVQSVFEDVFTDIQNSRSKGARLECLRKPPARAALALAMA